MKRVAVIGGGLGGLTAAGELARRGHAVTLFERGPALGGKARAERHDGITLDTGPTLLTLPHVVRAAFLRLEAEDLLPRFVELPLQCAYRWDDGRRLQVWRDLDESAASADALAAGEGEALRRFYATAARIHRAAGEPYLEAPLEGTVEYMLRVARRGLKGFVQGAALGTLASLADRHFATPHLRAFAGRFATYAGASPWGASAAFSLIPHLERVFGVHHVVGGMGALSAALGLALSRLGVTVRLNADAAWAKLSDGFEVGPRGEAERFDAVVVNADPLASLGRSSERLALSGYVLLLAAKKRVALPHHTISFAPDYRAECDALFEGRLPAAHTFYVCHPAASDETAAPAGQSGLYVMVNASPLPRGFDGDYGPTAALLRERCFAHLRALCPELSWADVRVIGERTPDDLLRGGAPGGSIYGFLPHGRLGPFRRPRMRSRTPGLYYSGGGTHPGGGVPLVMLSGHFAAELAASHLEAAA